MKQHLIILTAFFGICLFSIYKCERERPPKQVNTDYAEHLKERAELLQENYVRQAEVLQQRNDSLQTLVENQKGNLKVYRFRAKELETQLKSYVADSGSVSENDTLFKPLLDEYIAINGLKDSTCDSTINKLEEIICNKDEELSLSRQVNESLRDLTAEQAAQMQQLTDALETAYKQQRKKVVRNRILSTGLMLVSGFAGAQLIIHNQK